MPTSPAGAGGGRTSSSRLRARGCRRRSGGACRRSEHGAPRAARGGGQLVPLETSLLIPQLAVDVRADDPLRRAAKDDGRGWILPGQVRRTGKRDDRDVGALSWRQRSDLGIEAEGAGGAERAELER